MSNLLNILNETIEVSRDGQNGYKTALEGVKTSGLQTLFNEYSQQRATFASELQSKIEDLGEQAQVEGSIKSSLHRAWINIKSIVTGRDEEAILEECLNGDKIAIAVYEKNLKEELPSDIRFILNDQLSSINIAYNRILEIKNTKDI